MTTQSTANNPGAPAQAQIPAIRSFQFDGKAIGDIKKGVNYFRGNVLLPIDFLLLTGREGLDVKVSAIYNSTIRNQISTWNSEAPTGVLGLGWDMPLEHIAVFKSGSGSRTSDQYYLVSNGSANPLVATKQIGNDIWVFQARNYEFWDIQYNTTDESWTIIKEDGFVYSYGGKTNEGQTLQFGVKWGNWIGSSSQIGGQEQYCVAWNLASVESTWGQRVAYTYLNVERPVGSGGRMFTQASYVRSVHDSVGRTITFNYGKKYGDQNPHTIGNNPIVEYQAQNAGQPQLNAYQDKFETLFLDSVDVRNADGEEIYRLKFVYDFINTAITSDPSYSLLWKRCLKSVFQYVPDGAALPGMQFEYADRNETNPGALKAVTYPSGGVARMVYKKMLLDAPKRITIRNPLPQSIPGVWHGDDYVVFTFCRPDRAGISVLVRSWNGRWVEQNFDMPGTQADPESVRVVAESDFIALSFRNKSLSRDELYIYQRERKQFGDWSLYNNQPFLLSVRANAGPSSFVAGGDFVIACNKDYSASSIQGFSWVWQTNQWTTPTVMPDTGGDGVVLAAAQNFYIVVRYFRDTKQAMIQILYRDQVGNWQPGAVSIASDFPVLEADGKLLLSVTPNPTFFVATHITASDSSKVSYRVDIFDWDESFRVLNAFNPAQARLETPRIGDSPVYDIFRTITSVAFVNNNTANLRNTGAFSPSSGGNWLKRDFQLRSTNSSVKSAAGEDVALLCENSNGVQNNQMLTFNPNFPTDSGWSFPSFTNAGSFPTVSGNFLTMGKAIYGRTFRGEWFPLQTQLSGLTAEETVQNRAPNYIAYQDTDGPAAKSYFVAIRNGQASTPTELPGGAARICVSPKESCSGAGTNLAGPRFLVSYKSSSFCSADQLFLQNLDEGDISDFVCDYPIAYIEIDDACNPEQSFHQSYFYANSSESQIAYNAITGVAQYPLVYELPGVKSDATSLPKEQRNGRSERYFSNGLSPQAGLYPSTWISNYQNLLNGMLLAQKNFDFQNKLVSSELNYWQVFTNDPNNAANLYGGYVRAVRNTTMKDDVVTDSYSTYDPTTGLTVRQEQQYYDSEGNRRTQRSEKLYAWQVAAYKAAFTRHHIYSTVVQETQSVSAKDGVTQNYGSEVTTFRNWSDELPGIQCSGDTTEKCRLAPWQKYVWTTPGTTPPQFDFSFEAKREGWLLTTEIVERSRAEGAIHEQRDVNGVPSSFIYDNGQRYKTADFPNGSLRGDEVSYWGFEAYEDGQGWQLGPGAAIVPESVDSVVDAHTGLRSLCLAASTTGRNGISRIFQPARQGMPYIFSAWVKKPTDFDNSLGNGRWQISVAGGNTFTIEFPDTVGQWLYVSQEFDVPVGSTGVEILGQNLNTASQVLIDDIRFSPFSCLFEGTGYDTNFWLPNAGLGANGESDRTVYDSMQRRTVRTNSADSVTEVLSSYFSRSGNRGKFSPADPNRDAQVRAAQGGTLCTFTRGSEWQQLWHSPTGVWRSERTVLTQNSAGLAGTLSITDLQYASDYVLEAGFETREAVRSPLGIRFGRNLTVQWNPQLLIWELLDGQGNIIQTMGDTALFNVPAKPFSQELKNGVVSDALYDLFDRAGYPLPPGSAVSSGTTAGKSWIVTSSTNRFRYDLLESGAEISVHRVVGDWLAIVADRALVFSVAGRQVFSYEASSTIIDAAPELYFGDRVAISRLSVARRPHVEISYTDSRNYQIQLQALAENCTVVSQTIPDDMGRSAVRTKSAYVKPDVSPLLAFCAGFARIDWATGIMTGIVADTYPEDGGYPYSRETYERSPLERVIEQGAPGELFRIGAQSTRIQYTNADNKFHKTITTNPNDAVFYELRNNIDQVVSMVAIGDEFNLENQTIFDDAGNPSERRSPNYFRPPAGSVANEWVDVQRFDYAGRVKTSQSGNQGKTQYIYDRAGNLRFMQDPQGRKSGNFNYVKYDMTGRQVEAGYITSTWDTSNLQDLADSDPAWPTAPLTWRKQYTYDGSQRIRLAIGRVTEVRVNNTDDGAADVIEQFRYDILGNTTVKTLIADDYERGVEYRVDYGYNNLGAIVWTKYPETPDAEPLSIYQLTNRLNQLIAISETADFSSPLATFSYRPNGQPCEQTLSLGEEQLKSTYNFNSPLWLTNIRQESSDGSALFGETLTYTEGGFERPGQDGKYYDGTVASATFHGSTDDQFRYAYSGIGAIETAHSAAEPDRNLGVQKPVAYDANGNFDTVVSGTTEKKFDYFDGTQRLRSVRDAVNGTVVAGLSYDDNGNATNAMTMQSGLSNTHDLSIKYDPATKMTTRIENLLDGGNTLSFRYGHDNNRVLKDVRLGQDLVEKKLYVRGLNSLPLCELTTGTTAASVIYIYGPAGLLAMRRDRKTYGVLKDHLGSTRAIVDSKANVVAKYDYLTFGSLSICDEILPGFMPYLFTGQEYDREIGLYNYRSRFYSAELGRFLAVDPQSQFFSPYLYASNNPVLFIDPTGGIATWARVLFGVGMAIIGVAVIGLSIVTGGAASPAVAAWAAGLGASAGVAAGVGTAAAVVTSAALGAASGAALGSSFYALGTSNEDFSWQRLGQQAALGAIAGAITGGLAQGLSIGGQAIATARTGITVALAEEAASQTAKSFVTFAARQAIVGGVSAGIAGAAGSGVSGAVSNIWGLTNLGPGAMALSIFSGLGSGAVKGAAGGIGGAAWSARLKTPVMGVWDRLSTTQKIGGGVVGGVAVVGGSYGYLYNRESAKENA